MSQPEEIRAVKDASTVTSSGERLSKLIDGVTLRRAITHEDERGELAEIMNPAWGVEAAPINYVYQVMTRPGRIKGWVYHKLQFDRMFVISGFSKYVLWDPRPQSPTHGMVNEIFMSERNKGLLLIPPYVVHAVQNIGLVDSVFINMPTVPYNHASPDTYRLEAKEVPYSFDKGTGW